MMLLNTYWKKLSKKDKDLLLYLSLFQGFINLHPITLNSFFQHIYKNKETLEASKFRFIDLIFDLIKYGWIKKIELNFSENYLQIHSKISGFLNQKLNSQNSKLNQKAFLIHYENTSSILLQLLNSNDFENRKTGQHLAELEYGNIYNALKYSIKNQTDLLAHFSVIISFHLAKNELSKCLFLATHLLEQLNQELLICSKRQNLHLEIIGVLDIIGRIFRTKGNWKKAEIHFLNILDFYKENNLGRIFPAGLGEIYRILGVIERDLGNLSKSKMYFEKATKIFEELNEEHSLAEVYQNLGKYFYELKDYKNAERYFERALKLFERQQNPFSIAKNHQLLAGVFYQTSQLDKSRENYTYCLKVAKEKDYSFMIAKSLQGLGILSSLEKAYENSVQFYKSALNVFLKMSSDYSFDIAQLYYNIGNDCYNLNLFEESRDYYRRSLDSYLQLKNTSKQAEILQNLANVAYHLGEIKESIALDESAMLLFIGLDRKKEIAEILYNAMNLAEELEEIPIFEKLLNKLSKRYKEPEILEILNLVKTLRN